MKKQYRCRRCNCIINLDKCHWACDFDLMIVDKRPKNMVFLEEYKEEHTVIHTLINKLLLSEVKE